LKLMHENMAVMTLLPLRHNGANILGSLSVFILIDIHLMVAILT